MVLRMAGPLVGGVPTGLSKKFVFKSYITLIMVDALGLVLLAHFEAK